MLFVYKSDHLSPDKIITVCESSIQLQNLQKRNICTLGMSMRKKNLYPLGGDMLGTQIEDLGSM